MSITLLTIAFAAGILSFMSPCIIPMLGVYFSLITGLSFNQLQEDYTNIIRAKILKNTIAFVLGFSVIFILAGGLAGELGSVFARWQTVLNILGGTMILILGLKLLGLFELSILNKLHWEPKIFEKIREKAAPSPITSFVVGLLFAIACSHCIAPTLYSIIALAGATKSSLGGMLVMALFSVGLSIPYILTGLSFNKVVKVLKKFRGRQILVSRLAGILMLYLSYIMYTGQLTVLTGNLARFLPRLPLGM